MRGGAADERRDVAPQAHWIALPAGERVSAPVRQLTGFHEGVLETAITPEEAWQRLRAVTSPAETTPAAIHYARFELSFLRAWAERFEPPADPVLYPTHFAIGEGTSRCRHRHV